MLLHVQRRNVSKLCMSGKWCRNGGGSCCLHCLLDGKAKGEPADTAEQIQEAQFRHADFLASGYSVGSHARMVRRPFGWEAPAAVVVRGALAFRVAEIGIPGVKLRCAYLHENH